MDSVRLGKRLRPLMCALLIILVLRRIEVSEVKDLLGRIDWRYAVLIPVFIFLQLVVRVYKWSILMRARKLSVPFGNLLHLDYVSSFLGLSVPSAVSSDFFRGYGLARSSGARKDAVSSVVADRWTGLCSLLLLAAAGSLSASGSGGRPGLVLATTSLLAGFLILSAIVSSSLPAALLGRFEARSGWIGAIAGFERAVAEYRRRPASVAAAVSLSLLIQVFRVLVYFFAALALHQKIPFGTFFAYVPIVLLTVMLPVSLAGIGVRESAFFVLFEQNGVSAPEAFAIPFLVSITVLLSMAPAGILYMKRGLSPEKKPSIGCEL